jgi:serine/threonine protein kinase
MSSVLPKRIGRYEISRELARGGRAVVYLGRDPFIDRPIAIKASISSPFEEPGELERFRQRFFNEARASGKLTHPHIATLHDANIEADMWYLVMEYVDGMTLREYYRGKGALPVDEVAGIIFQCAKALSYAHDNGVIHRDVKPTNIMISSIGEVKISDFGAAKVDGTTEHASSDSLTGSLHYTSPEELRGEPVSARSDLFSLGVVMYELLAGAMPFEAETDVGVCYKIVNDQPEPLKKHRVDIPESLGHIVMRALQKDPSKRYQSCLQLASELKAAFEDLKVMDEKIEFEEKCNALKRIHFFHDFKLMELAEVLRIAQWYEFEANATIISEEEFEGDSFYIIVDGEVLVRKHGKPLNALKRGDCFGEMAYLGKSKRTATIEALRNSVLMKIGAPIAGEVSDSTQLRFYKAISTTLIQRLARASELLSH